MGAGKLRDARGGFRKRGTSEEPRGITRSFSRAGKTSPRLGPGSAPLVGSFLTLPPCQCQWPLSPVSGPPVRCLEILFMHLKGVISTKWLLKPSHCSE